MKAILYLPNREEPVAVFDTVNVVAFNDNHKANPTRIAYKTASLNASKTMLELYRDVPMTIRLDDGRAASVLLQHNSIDMQGNAVGILRVMGDFHQ